MLLRLCHERKLLEQASACRPISISELWLDQAAVPDFCSDHAMLRAFEHFLIEG
jgi:hypothetical protein